MSNIKLFAEDALIVGEYIYFISGESTMLFATSIVDNSTSIVSIIPEELFFINQAFRRMLYWNNELIFIPYNARSVHFYNINSKTWRKSKCIKEEYNHCMYIEALIHNDKLIMIGADEPNIIEMDLDDLSFKIVNMCFEKYKVTGELICRGGYSVFNNVLYIAIATKNVVVGIDLEDWSDKEYNIVGEVGGFSGIARIDGNYWLAPRKNGNIIKWNGEDRFEKIDLPFELDKSVCYFGGLCFDDKYIYIYGLSGNFTVRIGRNTGFLDYYKKQYVFLKSMPDNKTIGQVLCGTIEVSEHDRMTRIACSIEKNKLNAVYKDMNYKSILSLNLILKEKDYFGLSDYIGCISQNL